MPCMTDEPETYKPEVFCNITMLRPIRRIPFPQLGQRYLCSLDLQGRFKAFDKLINEVSLYCIRSWKIIQGIKNLDRQLQKLVNVEVQARMSMNLRRSAKHW